VVNDPQNQTDDYADDEASDEWKVKCAVRPAVADITGESTEAERQSWAEVEECAEQNEHGSSEEQQAAELLSWFHADSLALEGLWLQVARIVKSRSLVRLE
jgi:hypothetical protein